MKRNQKSAKPASDSAATRKRRLNKRLQEISERGDQELSALAKSLDRIKASFKKPEKS